MTEYCKLKIRGFTTQTLAYSVTDNNILLSYETFRYWKMYGASVDEIRQVVALCVKGKALKLIQGGDVEDPDIVYELIDYDKMMELLS